MSNMNAEGTVMDLKKLQKLIENPKRIFTLSTADEQGIPNTAIFGSVQLKEDEIIIGMGNNRSLNNLQKNPRAALMMIIPGANLLAFQGIRLYLELKTIERAGPLLDDIRAEAGIHAGRAAARMIQQALTFRIIESRPLVDLSSLIPPT